MAVTLSVAVAAQYDSLLLLAGLAVGLLLMILGAKWPLTPLLVVAAIIPFDEVVQLGDLGTIGRAAGLLFALSYAFPRLGRIQLRTIPSSGWVYLGWALLSITWALDQDTARDTLLTFVQLFALAVLVADLVVHRPAVVMPVLWAYSLSAALLSVIGVEAFLSSPVETAQRAAALAGQNPAQYATVLLPAFVFALDQLVRANRPILSAAIALLTGVGIVLSGTRGVWFSAALVGALFFVPRLRPRQFLGAATVVLALLIAVSQIPGVAEFLAFRTETAISSGGAGRTDIWAVGVEIIRSSPVVGSGFGNFPEAFTSQHVAAADITADVGTAQGPHNIIIGPLGELGVIGFAALVLFLGPLILRAGWGPYGRVVQAGLVSLMGSALFLDILSNRKQVWLYIGLAVGLAYLRRHAAPRTRRSRQRTGFLFKGLQGRRAAISTPMAVGQTE